MAVYAVGAVGYYLLTGQPVFDAGNLVDLCQQHVATPPIPPSERAKTMFPAELENALLENVLGVKVQREEERVSGLYKCQFTLID